MMRFSQLSYMRCRCHFWLCTPEIPVHMIRKEQAQRMSGRQELAMGTLRYRSGLPYGAKSLHSGEER